MVSAKSSAKVEKFSTGNKSGNINIEKIVGSGVVVSGAVGVGGKVAYDWVTRTKKNEKSGKSA